MQSITDKSSSETTKKIMCINANLQVAQQIGKVFHDSPIVKKLGSKGEYTNTSTWLKISVLHLIQSNPSAEKLSKLFESCKTDSVFLPVLAGEELLDN
jgi:hypothetical protein